MTHTPIRACVLIAATMSAMLATTLASAPVVNALGTRSVSPAAMTRSPGVDRVQNLRLQRIDTGPMRGRLVVAGRMDHVGAASPQNVRTRITVRAGHQLIARHVTDYVLSANVAPQDMTLRLLLTREQTRRVDKAGDSAIIVVDVWQNAVLGAPVQNGDRYTETADRLTVERMPVAPAGQATRASTAGSVWIPAGYYSTPDNTYYLSTSEDPSGLPFVGALGFVGTAANDFQDYWALQPAWLYAGQSSATPGPGTSYVYGSPPQWSTTTNFLPGCPDSVNANGTFAGSNAIASWSQLSCSADSIIFPILPGSASMQAS